MPTECSKKKIQTKYETKAAVAPPTDVEEKLNVVLDEMVE